MAKKPSKTKSSPRTDVVTIRFKPELKYLAEIGARYQNRSLSSFIEWAVEQSLDASGTEFPSGHTIKDFAGVIWDVDEADRFAKLALQLPQLLTFEEQVLWKKIKENSFFWSSQSRTESSLIFIRLRDNWQLAQEAALGDEDAEKLFQDLHVEDDSFDIPF